jgi:hypothetical protein
MNDQTDFSEQSAAFQKIWLESMSKLMQAACTFSPNSAPPELLREIRSGIFQALSETWNEFLRSPQFHQSMKQWMDSAVAFRKMSNDFMAKVRKEMQAPSRDDIDTIMLTVRHMETRLLDRIDALSKQIEELKKPAVSSAKPDARTKNAPNGRARKTSRRPAVNN